MQLEFETKVPDAGMKLRQTALDFSYQREFRGMIPEAYERLLLDALEGDASLFARADEVEASWAICDPILEEWQRSDKPELHIYEPSLWGPEESTRMDGRPRPAVVRHLPRAALSRELRVKSREPEFLRRINEFNRQTSKSLARYPALEKLWLARWAAYDLAIFGLPLVAAHRRTAVRRKPWCLLVDRAADLSALAHQLLPQPAADESPTTRAQSFRLPMAPSPISRRSHTTTSSAARLFASGSFFRSSTSTSIGRRSPAASWNCTTIRANS